MRSTTAARKRASGEAPYKTPLTDGRRARWAIPTFETTAETAAAMEKTIVAAVVVAVRQIVRPHKSSPQTPPQNPTNRHP